MILGKGASAKFDSPGARPAFQTLPLDCGTGSAHFQQARQERGRRAFGAEKVIPLHTHGMPSSARLGAVQRHLANAAAATTELTGRKNEDGSMCAAARSGCGRPPPVAHVARSRAHAVPAAPLRAAGPRTTASRPRSASSSMCEATT